MKIIPCHCSGLKAVSEISKDMSGAFIRTVWESIMSFKDIIASENN
jgi:metal-dependent hydrolase (beta-lactamase superfamily II)